MKREDYLAYEKKLSDHLNSLSLEEKVEWYKLNKNLCGPKMNYPASILNLHHKYFSDDEIENAFLYNKCDSLAKRIADIEKIYGNIDILGYQGQTYKIQEIINKGDLLADNLARKGVKPGDIVNVCLPCVPEFLYFFYAINKIGAISNWIDFRASENELRETFMKSKSKLYITFNGTDDKLLKVIDDNDDIFDNIIDIIKVKMSDSLDNFMIKNLAKLKDERIINNQKEKLDLEFSYLSDYLKPLDKHVDFYKYKQNEPAVIVYTGGTTGVEKGVVHSCNTIDSLYNNYANSHVKLEAGNKFLHFLPPWTAYGIVILYTGLLSGVKCDLLPKLDPNTYDKLLKKEKPNYTTGIPKNLEILINSKSIKKSDDLSYLKYLGVGADKLSENLELQAIKFLNEHNCFIQIAKGYGMTETCATFATSSNNVNKLGSVGIPFATNSIKIVDENNNEVPVGVEGEILMSGPSIMLEYMNNKEETDRVLETDNNGVTWVRSKDIGKIDMDGFLYVTGRLKRMYPRCGFKIFCDKIENVVSKHPGVKSCCCVCLPHEVEGHIPYVLIVPKEETNYNELIVEIDTLARKDLYEYYFPLNYIKTNNIPLTKNGKMNYRLVENTLLEKFNANNADSDLDDEDYQKIHTRHR